MTPLRSAVPHPGYREESGEENVPLHLSKSQRQTPFFTDFDSIFPKQRWSVHVFVALCLKTKALCRTPG